jgi:hypothetical protein
MTHRLFYALIVAFCLIACGDNKENKIVSPDISDNEGSVGNKGDPSLWDLSKIVLLDSVRSMPKGTRMFVRTVFAGDDLEDFEVKMISVVNDLVPPMPMIMLETSDPIIVALGGVSEGMSGSPVFTKDGVVGALSMSFYSQNHPPYYFFATPIEWMQKGIFDQEIRSGKMAKLSWNGNSVKPLALRVLMSGVNSRLVDSFISENVESDDYGFLSMLSSYGSSGVDQNINVEFKPGSPLAIAVVTGDEVVISGVGTVTYVQGNNILGFGHSMFGTGSISAPIIGARILGEISGVNSPYKFFTLSNKIYGTLLYDRAPGVGGVLGQEPQDMIPIVFNASIFGKEAFGMTHKMISGMDPYNQAVYSGFAMLSPLENRLDGIKNASIKIRTQISFKNSDLAIDRERIYSCPDLGIHSLIGKALTDFINVVYVGCFRNGYSSLETENIQMYAEVIDRPMFAVLTGLESDSLITAGGNLNIKVKLRVGGIEDKELNFTLAVPDTFSSGIYTLSVGPKSSLGEDAGSNTDAGEFRSLEDVFEGINSVSQDCILKLILSFDEPMEGETVFDYNDRKSLEIPLDLILLNGTGSIIVKVSKNE